MPDLLPRESFEGLMGRRLRVTVRELGRDLVSYRRRVYRGTVVAEHRLPPDGRIGFLLLRIGARPASVRYIGPGFTESLDVLP